MMSKIQLLMLKIQSAPGSGKPPENDQGGTTEETVL